MPKNDLAKVAIVGRPNVGKSALFNRLMGKRIAIVDGAFGVTRDRISGICTRGGAHFELYDMGGFVSRRREGLEESVNRQIVRAVALADVIVFVVDAIAGPVPEDENICEMVRREGKPVILAANKADNPKLEDRAVEFFGLGLGEPLPVSAAHNRNIGALLEEIAEKIPPGLHDAAREGGEPTRFCIVGRQNVGKSTLVNAILGEERCVVSDVPGTTRDSVDSEFSLDGRDYAIVDTAGMKKQVRALKDLEFYSYRRACGAVERSSVAVLLIDAVEGIVETDKKIAAFALESGKGMVIGVNKMDLIEEPVHENFLSHLADSAPFLRYTPVVFLSALRGEGVENLLGEVAEVARKMGAELPAEELENEVLSLVELFPPKSLGKRPTRVFSVRQTGKNPPKITLLVSNRDAFPDSYLRSITNRLVETYGLYGVPLTVAARKKPGKKKKRSRQ
ncbi:MAG: ribosome biogenesis GTPase Der [bacterium]